MATVGLINNMASQGSITASPYTAKLNGKQIATVKSLAVHDKLGTDVVKDGIGGIQLNGSPISFVGGMTALGQSIMDMGLTTAKMTGATHYGLPECPLIEGTEIVSSEVTLTSDYAWTEFLALSKDVAEATFTLMLSETFGTDIGLYAYAALYRDASEDKLEKPNIVVIKNRIIRYAAFHKHTQEIHVNEALVREATVDGDEEAITLLYAALNEEFGHYLDWLLRNKYTQQGGDAELDEGAMYGYLMTGFDIFKTTSIAFGNATVDGTDYPLQIELKDLNNALNKALDIYKQEIANDAQTPDYELFGAGLGNPENGFYGHYGIEKVLERGPKLKGKFDEEELNFTYLGNFLRDYSQLITPLFMGFNKEERAKVEAGFGNKRAKEVLGMGRWLNPLKPGRDTLTSMVEIMAAHETLAHTNKASIEFPSASIFSVQGLVDRAAKIGMAVKQLPKELVLFHQNYLELNQDIVGVYRPEEHIDNPIGVSVIDTEKDDYLYCPEGSNPEINDTYGMKNYIRHDDDHVKVHKTYIQGKGDYKNGLPTTVTYVKQQLDKMNTIAKAGNPKKGLVYFGNALHALEDFYAHTNFVELALMKVKGDWVFPWVDVNAPELVDYNCEGKRFEVKNEREIYHDFKRYPEQGEIDFFDRNGFIKTLTKQEINILHSKFRNKKSKGEDVVFSYLGITGGVSDTYVTPGLPEAGVKYWKLYYEFEGIRYLIKSVEKRREIIKSSLFGLGWVDWNTYRDVKAELHLVPNSKYNDEVVVRAYNNKKQQTYEHIPLVTGLFRGEDAMYSIEDKLLSFIETEAFTLADFKTNDGYSIPGAGKGSKYVLSAVDYMVMLILEDLAKKQDSEADRSSKHVGKKASEYIKNYKTFIEYRATIFTVIDSLPKVPKYIAEVLLNSMKKMAMNLVKGMLRAMVIGNMKEFKASQNVKYKLGTNPTHTQIAKDSPTHPFHGLAAELAKIAVQDIGSHVHDYLFSDKALTIEDIKRKTEEYFSHPKDIDWMDITVYKWLAKEMAKKPGMITRFNHWVAKSWDVSKEDLEKLIQQDHDMFGVPYDKNKYKEYLEDSEAYQKQLEASGNAKSKVKHNHGDHHDHDDEACDEHDKKADEDFFKEIKEKMDAQEEVFIEDMNLSEQWIEHYLNKIEVVLKESSDDIKKIMSVFEKSKDISAFVEDLKFRPDGMSIEDIEAKIEERLEDLKASFINYSKMKLKEKFKD